MVLRLVEASADFLFWLAMRVARSSVVRFLGVPPELEESASDADREDVTRIMRSVLPLSSRVAGIAVDSSVTLSPWPLERIRVPVLIISATDDLFKTLPGAQFTTEQIPGAELRVLEHGGHLMVGQGEQVKDWIRQFLGRKPGPSGKSPCQARLRPRSAGISRAAFVRSRKPPRISHPLPPKDATHPVN